MQEVYNRELLDIISARHFEVRKIATAQKYSGNTAPQKKSANTATATTRKKSENPALCLLKNQVFCGVFQEMPLENLAQQSI